MPAKENRNKEEDEGTLKKLKKDVKRIKRLRYLKMLLSLLIVSGVAIDLGYTYAVAKDVQIVDKKISSITPEGELRFRATLTFTFDNPRDRELDLEGLTYRIYVEGSYLGEGEKGAFTISPGLSNHTFDIHFDLRDLGAALDSALGKEVLHLRVKGHVKVPARFFGLYTWRVLELPYDVTETFTIKGGSVVVPPVTLYVPVEVTYSSVTLDWSRYAGEDFSRYEVHYSTQPNFQISSNTLAGVVEEIDTTTYTVENLRSRTTYYFKIRVYSIQGLQADSNEVSATTLFLPFP
ncbi:MAG: hypothetical protein DRN55_04570 [Thermoplasmata archaeon]|nr:MAG: hypothetical protein DRN55_04570 [Thermoplasmata archaeon]